MAAIQTDIGTLKNFIDGEWVEPAGGTDTVFNPATGEELAQAPVSSPEDVDRAVQAAKKALPEWLETTPGERADHPRGLRLGDVATLGEPVPGGHLRHAREGRPEQQGALVVGAGVLGDDLGDRLGTVHLDGVEA